MLKDLLMRDLMMMNFGLIYLMNEKIILNGSYTLTVLPGIFLIIFANEIDRTEEMRYQ